MTLTDDRRAALGRRVRWLAMATVGYNAVEAAVAVTAGQAADSIGLVAFGLDSLVEMSSGLVVLWQFRHPLPQQRERRAQRALSVAFGALAVVVTLEAGRVLLGRAEPDPSTVGIVLTLVSLAVMPMLAWAKRRTGRELKSTTVVADSLQTLLCTYLSAVLLVGLVLNSAVGWWWADPVAAIAIAVVAVREVRELWRGDGCADGCHG